MSRSVKCRACSRSPWSPPPSSPRPEGEARPVPPIRKREFIMTLYFPENTYYELPFKEVVYYAFHGHSCVSRQPRSGRGGGGEEKKKEWEEVFSLLFSLSRIKIPVIHFLVFFSDQRLFFRLSFFSVDTVLEVLFVSICTMRRKQWLNYVCKWIKWNFNSYNFSSEIKQILVYQTLKNLIYSQCQQIEVKFIIIV